MAGIVLSPDLGLASLYVGMGDHRGAERAVGPNIGQSERERARRLNIQRARTPKCIEVIRRQLGCLIETCCADNAKRGTAILDEIINECGGKEE